MENGNEEIFCTNCSAPIAGMFCSACGQKRFILDDLTINHFLKSSFQEFFNFDSRLLRSIRPLLLEPGALTLHYISGRQKQFIKPVTLFVVVNIFFFFVGYRAGLMNWKMEYAYGEKGMVMVESRAGKLQVEPAVYLQTLNDIFRNYQRSFFFGVIPLFAILMKAVFFRKHRSLVEFIIYSIHYHSSYLILLPVTGFSVIFILGLVDKIIGTQFAQYFGNDPGIAYYAIALMVLYHFFALKRIYRDNSFMTFIQAIGLSIASGLIMVPLGQTVLFWLVWITTS